MSRPVPTTPTTYKISEVLADPVRLNSNLGLYTNFVNLLDLCAVTIPVPGVEDHGRPPHSISLIGPAWTDPTLVRLAASSPGARATHPTP